MELPTGIYRRVCRFPLTPGLFKTSEMYLMGAMLRSSLEKRNILIRYGQAGEGLGKAERGLGGD